MYTHMFRLQHCILHNYCTMHGISYNYISYIIHIMNNMVCMMQINGQYISWEHLTRLHNKQMSKSGFKLLWKLTNEHIHLNSYSRMRVNLAAQVSTLLCMYEGVN